MTVESNLRKRLQGLASQSFSSLWDAKPATKLADSQRWLSLIHCSPFLSDAAYFEERRHLQEIYDPRCLLAMPPVTVELMSQEGNLAVARMFCCKAPDGTKQETKGGGTERMRGGVEMYSI